MVGGTVSQSTMETFVRYRPEHTQVSVSQQPGTSSQGGANSGRWPGCAYGIGKRAQAEPGGCNGTVGDSFSISPLGYALRDTIEVQHAKAH